MWLPNSISGNLIVIQPPFPQSLLKDNPNIKLITLPQLNKLMASTQKTEKCEEEAAEAAMKEPGVEFVKSAAANNAQTSASTHLHLLPTIHNPVQVVAAPIYNSYRSVFQGWKNSVPKLYKYSPSDIEVVVYRKNGQVDKLKKATEFEKGISMEHECSSTAPIEMNAASTSFESNDSMDDDGNSSLSSSPKPNPVKHIETKASASNNSFPEDLAEQVDALKSTEIKEETVTQTPDFTTAIPGTNGSQPNNPLIMLSSTPDMGEQSFNEAMKENTVEEKTIAGKKPVEEAVGSLKMFESCDKNFVAPNRCCLISLAANNQALYNAGVGSGVSKALLDVATQATMQVIKSIEVAVQHVPDTKDGYSQHIEGMRGSRNMEIQTEPLKLDSKYTETDSQGTGRSVKDFCCQMTPITSTIGYQTESAKTNTSSCQTFCAQIPEGTQTETNVCSVSANTQTYVARGSSMNQTDPDILRSIKVKSTQACQTMMETVDSACQVDARAEMQDFEMQCKPDHDSKAIQLSAVCCRQTAKRISMKYESKLCQLLSSVENYGKKKVDRSSSVENGQSSKSSDSQPAASSSTDGEYTPEMIREMIATFKKRQKETDELQEELKRLIDQLTEQVSISRSLDSHEYIEDDWLQDDSPSASA